MNTNSNQEQEQVLSKEQLAELKEKQLAFYKENQELLEAQCNFEEVKARIEKAKLDTLKSKLERIHIELSMQKEDEDEDAGVDRDIDKKD